MGPGLVKLEKIEGEEIVKPITMLPNIIELSYYSNGMLQHYALRSVIALAIENTTDSKNGYVTQEKIVEYSLELCDILQYEFLFCKPCQNLELTIIDAIDNFMFKELLISQNNEGMKLSRRFLEDTYEEEQTYQSVEYKINEKHLDELKFLRDILKPWLEAYSVSACNLEKLVDGEMLEQDFVKEVLEDMKEQLRLGNISYGEFSICPPFCCLFFIISSTLF